jgi:hypothetical protein
MIDIFCSPSNRSHWNFGLARHHLDLFPQAGCPTGRIFSAAPKRKVRAARKKNKHDCFFDSLVV